MFKVLISKLAWFILTAQVLLPVYGQASDPTRPLTLGPEAIQVKNKEGLILQSIIRQGEIRKAVINGGVVKLGDKINGYQVIAITANGAVLKSAQHQLELSLFSAAVIQ